MIEVFNFDDNFQLFGKSQEVILRIQARGITLEYMLVPKSWIDTAKTNITTYRDKLIAIGGKPDIVDRHIAILTNPIQLNLLWYPSRATDPRMLIESPSISGIPSMPVNLPKPGAPRAARTTDSFAYLCAQKGVFYGGTHTDPNVHGCPELIKYLSTLGGGSVDGYTDVSSFNESQAAWDATPIKWLQPASYSWTFPGFSRFAVAYGSPYHWGHYFFRWKDPEYGYISYHNWTNTKTYDPRFGVNAGVGCRGGYNALLNAFASQFQKMHQIFGYLPSRFGATLNGSDPAAFIAAFNTDDVAGTTCYDLDWLAGEPLYAIGHGGSLEFLRCLDGAVSITSSATQVVITVTNPEIMWQETNEAAGLRLKAGGLTTVGDEFILNPGGTRSNIHTPISVTLEDHVLEKTKMWEYISKYHEEFPDQVKAPRDMTYAAASGTDPKLTFGDLNTQVVKRLLDYPLLRTWSTVSSKIASAAVRDKPWGAVMASPTGYRVAIRKSAYALTTSAGALVKAIDSVDAPYLIGNGVAVTFPDALNADPSVKFDEADYRARYSIPVGQTLAEAFSIFVMSPSRSQEEECQMMLATWVAEDGGFPRPDLKLVSNKDEGIRYIHCLHARSRLPIYHRSMAALGGLNLTGDASVLPTEPTT